MSASCEEVLPWIQPGWIGVEIGVAEGHSALRLLEYGVRFLYLIDPWQDYPEYLESHNHPPQRQHDRYTEAMERLSPFAGKHATLRMRSADAARHVPPVDFVWIDGNHQYEWIKSDLEVYWPMVRRGGVLCGHDFCNSLPWCEVKRAVEEFASANGLKVELPLPSWVIRKERS